MKKLWLLAFATLFLTSCANKASEEISHEPVRPSIQKEKSDHEGKKDQALPRKPKDGDDMERLD